MGALKRLVDPEDPQLTRADVFANQQIREDFDEDEGELWDSYLFAAREKVEVDSRRVLLPQTWRLSLDSFPCDGITIALCPLVSVESFEVIDSEGSWVTVDPENYEVDTESEPGRIVKSKGGVWPSPATCINGIRITFVAGYPDVESIPARAMQAVRLLVGHWYKVRSPVAVGSPVSTEIGFTYQNLLQGLRW